MKVRVPYLIQDPVTQQAKGLEPTEEITFEREAFCLDGPVTRRVAVLDFDPETGDLCPGARFVRGGSRDEPGSYKAADLADLSDLTSKAFMQVNALATVLSTLYLYEESDALGREVEWAFGAPQLLVIPRAGEWANAFYERASGSLQFFYFPSARVEAGETRTIFTALSQDIIAHETGHAILDGIAPDLYNCLTPQSLALHEAVADISALMVALRSRELRERLLEQTQGSISGRVAYTSLAEQFGIERDLTGRARDLRSLWNDRNLNPDDDTLDELHRPNQAARDEPHLLSEVLSGALYRVLAHLHEEYRAKRAAEKGISEFSASGWALFVASEHFKRLVLRSLDYLPPGEVSFADYGRAILASDQASYPGESAGRNALVAEFDRRFIIRDPWEFDVRTDFEDPAVAGLDLETLVDSDWAAYDFANKHRAFLGIPPDIHFRVRPRQRAVKKYQTYEGLETVEECIFKVSWDVEEPNPRDLPVTSLRQITVGTTLVIDWKSGRVRTLLTGESAGSDRPGSAQQRADRDAMIRHLSAARRLRLGAHGEDEGLFEGAVPVEVSGDLMRVRGLGRMLHLAFDDEFGERHAGRESGGAGGENHG